MLNFPKSKGYTKIRKNRIFCIFFLFTLIISYNLFKLGLVEIAAIEVDPVLCLLFVKVAVLIAVFCCIEQIKRCRP